MRSLLQRHGLAIAAVGLAALPLLAFGSSALRSDFVSLDDTLLITKNAAVQELTPRSVFHAFTSYDPELYIPLTLFSYQIEHALFGLTPAAFHIDNLLLHAGSAVVVFFLFRRLLKNSLAGWAVAALFAVHPLNTEAVLWAAARKDVLSTFFFLLSLLFYEESRTRGRRSLLRWSVAAFAAALLAKVTVLALPVLLLLLDWNRGERVTRASVTEKWPFFSLSALFAVIAAFGKTRNLGSLTAVEYVLIAAKSTAFYIGKLFWPLQLTVAYPQATPVAAASPEFFVPLLLVAALLALTCFLIRSRRDIAFGLLFFFLMLPVNYFNVWKNNFLFFASDRYAYIPALGIFAAVALMFSHVRRGFLLLFLCVTLPPLFLLAQAQARTWRSSETLYGHGLAVSPDSALLEVNLGDVLVRKGQDDQGLEHFLRAVQLEPGNVVALTNAGNLYKKRGDISTAQDFYRRAADAVPDDPLVEQLMGYYLLAETFLDAGKIEEGFRLLREATEKGSRFAEPFFNFGIMLQKYGQPDRALAAFEQAVAIDGSYLAARYHLAGLYAERGRLQEAAQQLRAIMRENPLYEKTQDHLDAIEKLLR